MFDKYIIDPGSIRNTGPSEAPTGFSFESKLGYYRGLGLSMVEELNVSLDGEAIPRSAIRFDEGPGPLTLDEMETAFDRRWAWTVLRRALDRMAAHFEQRGRLALRLLA